MQKYGYNKNIKEKEVGAMQLNRVNDVFFKYTLGSKERKNWTLNFLNITLDLQGEEQFTDISFADKDLLPQELDDKLSIVDILATTNNGTMVNIEVQVCKDKFMAERALYYWARIFGGQLHKKETYDKLHKVISLVLLDFDFFTLEDYPLYKDEYHQSYHIRNDNHRDDILSPLEMHFIELEKIQYSDIKSLKRSDRWIAYFSKKVSDADRKELANMEPVIKEALENEAVFLNNHELRRRYEAREKAWRDEQSRIKTAIEDERKRQEQEQIEQLSSLMKSLGINLEKAMNLLGFSDIKKEKYRKMIKE